jgi:hypothetical protein
MSPDDFLAAILRITHPAHHPQARRLADVYRMVWDDRNALGKDR